MITRKELLSSKEYWKGAIQIGLFNLIDNYLEENKINKTQFAFQMGVSKGYITQILNGDFDHKISKLVDLALICGKVPVVTYEDIDSYINRDSMHIIEPISRHIKIDYMSTITTEDYQKIS